VAADVSGGERLHYSHRPAAFFVTDKSTKLRFLINTGSDLCVYPL
jgi:hypothetical protein